jgi:DNA-binding transcriptional ArsR family regulator
VDKLQVIAEPRRREILRLVWHDELSAGEIAGNFSVTFGAVSQHLSVLKDSSLVTMRKDGRRRLYRANQEQIGDLKPILEAYWNERLDLLVDTIEADLNTPPSRPQANEE